MNRTDREDLLSLSIPERIRLVEDIWDSIAEHPETIALTDAQKDEVNSRLKDLEVNPHLGRPWSEVLDRIKKDR